MCGPRHFPGRDTFSSNSKIFRRFVQLRQNTSIVEQGCSGHSPRSANRKHQITRHPWRTSPPLRPSLSFRYTQVSLYVEHGGETFHSVHVESAQRVAAQALRASVDRLIHISGIGADAASQSRYIRKRGEGELAVGAAFVEALIIRP